MKMIFDHDYFPLPGTNIPLRSEPVQLVDLSPGIEYEDAAELFGMKDTAVTGKTAARKGGLERQLTARPGMKQGG